MLIVRSISHEQKETPQLADLCNDLIKRLTDSPSPNYDDIKRHVNCSLLYITLT